MFVRQYPAELSWDLHRGKKVRLDDSDYNKHVVQGFLENKSWVDPIHLVQVVEYGIVDNTKGEDALINVYNTWAEDV